MIKISPRALGMLFATVMLILAVICFRNYHKQLKQTDWTVDTATVTQVNEDYNSTASGDYNIYYDIYYTYTVNGQIYDGMINDLNHSLSVGDTLDIKYDPNEPDQSTYVTEPAKSILIIGIVFTVCSLVWICSHIRTIISERKAHEDIR